MTTKTIHDSFIRKYVSISGLHADLLCQMFKFKQVFSSRAESPCNVPRAACGTQVRVEEPINWQGGVFRFFYSLHALPCMGFEVKAAGKSFAYSSDTFYDKAGLEARCQPPARRRDQRPIGSDGCDGLCGRRSSRRG
jgi:hypothetical protein